MGLISKLLGGSTALLMIVVGIMFTTIKVKNNKIDELRKEVVIHESVITSASERIQFLNKKAKGDSLEFINITKEIQSTLAQVHNENKSLKKENSNLRKGVRLDLLVIRERRNGKNIDSTYTEAYKYLNK